MRDSQRYAQKMQRDDRVQKGLVSILSERGMWRQDLRLPDARKLLQEQPDFRAQTEWLQETVSRYDCMINYYPKFHCAFNFIELYWG